MNINSDLPASQGVAVTPGTAFDKCRALYVGTSGDLVVTLNGVELTFVGAAVGYHPIRATNVSVSSTAADIIALY